MSNDAYYNQDPDTRALLDDLEAERQANKKNMTIEQALEQGYERCGIKNMEYQQLMYIKDLTHDDVGFDEGIMIAEKEPFFTPSIVVEDLAEVLADQMHTHAHEITGDDTDEVYDIIKALDFTATANMINEALKDRQYWKLTDIELV